MRSIKNKGNDFEVADGYMFMIINSPKYCEFRAKIASEDYEEISKYTWCVRKDISIKSREVFYVEHGATSTKLQRFLTNPIEGKVVDFVNGDTLDYRKINLRVCSREETSRNRGVYAHNKSGVTGVYFNKQNNKWQSYITLKRKKIHLGFFEELEEAIEVRKQAEKKYYGKFARAI